MSLSSVSSFDTSFSTTGISATPTTDHPLYYLTDGNLKLQLDDRTVYNVHRYFFNAYSSRSAEEYPEVDDIHLVDDEEPVSRLLDVSREDFDRFLSLIYPSAIGVRDIYTADEWLSVLRLATRWSFDELRALAIRELEPIASAVDKIVTARELGKPEWLLPALVDVCMAPKWMGLEDAERLGMKTVVEIGRIREEMREAGDWDGEDVARAMKRAELVQEVISDEDDVEPQEAEARRSEAPSSPKKTFDDPSADSQTPAAPYFTHKDVSVSTSPVIEHCIATISRDASTSTSEDGSDMITRAVTRDAGDVAFHNASARGAIDVAAADAASVTAEDEGKSIATEDEEIHEALLVSAAPLHVLETASSACDATATPRDAAATPDDAANPNDTPAAMPEPPPETLEVAQEALASAERGEKPDAPAGGLDTLVDSASKLDAPTGELSALTEELAAPEDPAYPSRRLDHLHRRHLRSAGGLDGGGVEDAANVMPAVVEPSPSSSLSKGESSQASSSMAKAPPLAKPVPATPTPSSTTPTLAMPGRKRQASYSTCTSAMDGQEPPTKPLVQAHAKVAVAPKPASPPPCPKSRSRSPGTSAAAASSNLLHKKAFEKEAKTARVNDPKASPYSGVPFTDMVDESRVSPSKKPAKEQRAATRPSLSTKAPALAPVPGKPATPVKPVQAPALVKSASASPPPPPRYPAQSPAQPSWIPAQSSARKHTYWADELKPGDKPPPEKVTTPWNAPNTTSPSRRYSTHDDYGAYGYSSSRGGWDEDGWNLGATASRTSKSTQSSLGPSRRKTSEHSSASRSSYSYFGAPRFQRLSKEEVKEQQKKNPMFGIFATFDD
ncbi:uncharacterized protein SCHCODRAFT_02580127 [Schizophyllum commune H4-8]|uniref:BTB domain-containing protein n=1 Tax=Schizophyllum commune (strain H4-8 / FGSC 9210) TaxID=578458 RepID=D8Q6E1_SCHCM|nr:uncharacterized protein SCHCODRAFT_02580127 [Schizophyllum commune H4-8]KAI5890986.1 hypothetical protein SCHCODRAFT_02580127 [Schizophyllum commune H4-8]